MANDNYLLGAETLFLEAALASRSAFFFAFNS